MRVKAKGRELIFSVAVGPTSLLRSSLDCEIRGVLCEQFKTTVDGWLKAGRPLTNKAIRQALKNKAETL